MSQKHCITIRGLPPLTSYQLGSQRGSEESTRLFGKYAPLAMMIGKRRVKLKCSSQWTIALFVLRSQMFTEEKLPGLLWWYCGVFVEEWCILWSVENLTKIHGGVHSNILINMRGAHFLWHEDRIHTTYFDPSWYSSAVLLLHRQIIWTMVSCPTAQFPPTYQHCRALSHWTQWWCIHQMHFVATLLILVQEILFNLQIDV